MGWYYANGDQREGPVGDDALKTLASSGVLNGDTLVWCEGMTGWRPWREIAGRTFSGLGICPGCNQSMPLEDLVEILGCKVCARCKPGHLQCLREGVIPVSAEDIAGFTTGERLVCVRGKSLPTRCVRCNEPATIAYTRKFYWHPAWIYIVFFLTGPCLPFILLLFIRHKINLAIPLCTEHDAVRTRKIRIGQAATWFSVFLVVIGVVLPVPNPVRGEIKLAIIMIGMIGIFASALWTARIANILLVRRIGKRTAEFSRVSPDYLASLPPWSGEPD